MKTGTIVAIILATAGAVLHSCSENGSMPSASMMRVRIASQTTAMHIAVKKQKTALAAATALAMQMLAPMQTLAR